MGENKKRKKVEIDMSLAVRDEYIKVAHAGEFWNADLLVGFTVNEAFPGILSAAYKRANAVIDILKGNRGIRLPKDLKYRHAIFEFVAIEEAAKQSFSKGKSPLIRGTRDPILIILRELRNYESHIGINRVGSNDIYGVLFREGTDPTNLTIKDVDFFDNLSFDEFRKLDNIDIKELYDETDLKQAFDHFCSEQEEHGIKYMIAKASCRYIDHLNSLLF